MKLALTAPCRYGHKGGDSRTGRTPVIFKLKHRWLTALAGAGTLALLSWLGAWCWSGVWPTLPAWDSNLVALGIACGLGTILLDGVIHGICTLCLGATYQRAFDAHARAVFGTMGPPEIATGGLMAAVGEEPFFRGLLLPALAAVVGPVAAVAISSLVFAGCHWLSWRFWPFWLWACGEGLVFGTLYVATGSLLVPLLAHGIHDWVGYGYFWLLVSKKSPEPAVA